MTGSTQVAARSPQIEHTVSEQLDSTRTAAAAAFGLSVLFGGLALLRLVTGLLPDGPYWAVLAYVSTAVALAGLAAILVITTRSKTDKRLETTR